MSNSVFTIGHSTHSAEEFVALLVRHGVNAVADVRSSPYSRFNPQFNRELLKDTLAQKKIEYVFLGDELGARPKNRACYVAGKVSYDLLANTAPFQRGLDRIESGARKHQIALMCAEKDPLTCHRAILVARHLAARGIAVRHILETGDLESQDDAIRRLLAELGLPDQDLFRSHADFINEAYHQRGQELAYAEDVSAGEKEAFGASP